MSENQILFVIDNFLMSADLESTRAYAVKMEDRFSPATVVHEGRPQTLDVARRRARVLAGVDTGQVGEFFRSEIDRVLPAVLVQLALPIVRAKRISVQMTSSGDGHFYKPHA